MRVTALYVASAPVDGFTRSQIVSEPAYLIGIAGEFLSQSISLAIMTYRHKEGVFDGTLIYRQRALMAFTHIFVKNIKPGNIAAVENHTNGY